MRPGEKLYEELITVGEGIIPTGHRKVLVLRGLTSNGNTLNVWVDELNELAGSFDSDSLKDKLREMIPEYKPS